VTPEEFKKALRTLNIATQSEAADMFGIGSTRAVQYYLSGGRKIPGPLSLLVRLAVELPAVRRKLKK
tara:strand:- start:1114 stop:1314 length:201 start_codon:yes stop_codon:yes gene_type:complete